jgi:hypothetical protein
MGCKASQCQDQSEFLVTQPLPSFENTVVSSIFSDKSTKPSIDTFLRNQKLLTSSPLEFSTIFATAKLYLRDRSNFSELVQVLNIWQIEVFAQLQNSVMLAQDLHTIVALDSTGQRFIITHEVDGVRDFSMIRRFWKQIKLMKLSMDLPEFDEREFERSEQFLESLTPLTISFFLKLGSDLDCGMSYTGIGVNKPMGQSQLSQFFSLLSDTEGLGKWCYAVQPIPVGFFCALGSGEKTCSLYLFDGERELNYSRAMSLFEFYGAPLPTNIAEFLKTASGEEVHSLVTFGSSGILRLGIQVRGLEQSRVMELGQLLESPFEAEKCDKFNRTGRNHTVVQMELCSSGFVLTQSTSIS